MRFIAVIVVIVWIALPVARVVLITYQKSCIQVNDDITARNARARNIRTPRLSLRLKIINDSARTVTLRTLIGERLMPRTRNARIAARLISQNLKTFLCTKLLLNGMKDTRRNIFRWFNMEEGILSYFEKEIADAQKIVDEKKVIADKANKELIEARKVLRRRKNAKDIFYGTKKKYSFKKTKIKGVEIVG
jgi:hypothetical protein